MFAGMWKNGAVLKNSSEPESREARNTDKERIARSHSSSRSYLFLAAIIVPVVVLQRRSRLSASF